MSDQGYRHRYRLPASLGGAEYEGIVNGSHVLLNVPDVGAVPFPADVVTRVVPEEPEEGSFVAVMREAGEPPRLWTRMERHPDDPNRFRCWWSYDEQRWCTWEDIYTLGIPRLLTFAGLLIRSGGARGWCSICETTVPMRTDGKLKLHGSRHARCKGSQQYPTGGGA